MIQIPFNRAGHRDRPIGAQKIHFFGKRIGKTRGKHAVRTKERIAIFSDVWNGHDFAVAKRYQPFAQARFLFVVREARRSLARCGKARRKFIKTINARNFFDQIDFAFNIGAPRRMATGSNQAHSIRTFFVEKEISVSPPPMIPPMPTAREPSPSHTTLKDGLSVRSMPSRVLIFSCGLARRTTIEWLRTRS